MNAIQKIGQSVRKFFGGQTGYALWSAWRQSTSPRYGTSSDMLERVFSVVYACVDKRANAVAQGTWQLINPAGETVENHPLLDLLNDPDINHDGYELLYFTQAYIDCLGEAFIYIERGRARFRGLSISALITLRPDWMQLNYDRGVVTGYEYRPQGEYGGGTISFAPEEIIHIRRPNLLNPMRGQSIIQKSVYEIEEHRKMHESRNSLLDNDSTPPYILSSEQQLTDQKIEQMQSRIEDRHGGASKRGRAMILPGNLKPFSLPIDHKALFYLAEIGATEQSIARMFSVPMAILGDITDFNRANAEAAMAIFLQQAASPEADRDARGFGTHLLPLLGMQEWRLMLDLDIPEDRVFELDLINKLSGRVITVNEARSKLGYQDYPAPEADALQIQLFVNTYGIKPPAATEPAPEPSDEPKALDKSDKPRMSKAAFVKAFNRKQTAYEAFMKKTVDEWLDSYGKQVRARLRKSFKSDGVYIDALTLDDISEGIALAAKLEPQVRTIIDDYLETVAALFQYQPSQIDLLNVADRWLGDDWTNRMVSVSTETASLIAADLRIGVDLGEGIDKLAARVATQINTQKDYRSERIARTEVIGASNYGNHAGMKLSSVPFKEWDAAPAGTSENERESHQAMSGTIIPIDSTFDFGDAQMEFPGDPAGGAENTINCRCNLIPAFSEAGD